MVVVAVVAAVVVAVVVVVVSVVSVNASGIIVLTSVRGNVIRRRALSRRRVLGLNLR